MDADSLVIDRRYCGPPDSGNGGYVAGCLAAHLDGPVAVRLRRPPPLETPLRIERGDGVVQLHSPEGLLAEARPAALEIDPPRAPDLEAARDAVTRFSGWEIHPIRGCFVCGTERDEGDGLRIFPGPLADRDEVAAPWVPDPTLADESGRVRDEFLWSALDCPGAFAFPPSEVGHYLLGEMAAELFGSVRAGETCTVLAWPLGTEGRKRFAAVALYDGSGECVGLARETWIEIQRAQ